MSDELVLISLAVSSALVIALCSLGGWLVRRRRQGAVPAADADLAVQLDRALAELGVGADIDDTALAFAVDAVIADLEPESASTSSARLVVTMRSLLHPGAIVSLAMGRPKWATPAPSPDASPATPATPATPASAPRPVALFRHAAPPALPRMRSAKGSSPPPMSREFADERSTVQDVSLQRLEHRAPRPLRVRRERPVH